MGNGGRGEGCLQVIWWSRVSRPATLKNIQHFPMAAAMTL